jgi:glycerol-3-phosphate acyltransferase PlsY
MESFLLTVVVSYLVGSIPFGYLLVRIFRGEDVRESGSGNIGATNVSRKSPALGGLTLLLDVLKGSAAVVISIWLNPPSVLAHAHTLWYQNLPPALSPMTAERAAGAALFAVVGHMFPIWLKFRGGKGVATGLGSFVLIAPKAVLAAVGVFVVVVLAFRYVSLGSIVAVALFPLLVWLLHQYGASWLALGFMSLTSLLIVVRHHQNIRRLLAGTENRFGWKRGTRPVPRSEQR